MQVFPDFAHLKLGVPALISEFVICSTEYVIIHLFNKCLNNIPLQLETVHSLRHRYYVNIVHSCLKTEPNTVSGTKQALSEHRIR